MIGAGRAARPLDPAGLEATVDAFYAKVRRDPDLGPVFAAAVPDDEWPAHLARIRAFWSNALFRTGGYGGNPLGAHARLDGLTPALFGRWLALFGETAREILRPDDADALHARASRIAESLQAGLFFRPERERLAP